MSKTMAPHVHYTFWYISLSCSAKQQREMTSFKVLGRTGTHDCEFYNLFLNLSAVSTNLAHGQFGHIRQVIRDGIIAN